MQQRRVGKMERQSFSLTLGLVVEIEVTGTTIQMQKIFPL